MKMNVIDYLLEEEEGTLEIAFIGTLDSSNVLEFEGKITDDIKGRQSVVFDFANLDFINDAGMGLICYLISKIQAEGGAVSLRNADDDLFKSLHESVALPPVLF